MGQARVSFVRAFPGAVRRSWRVGFWVLVGFVGGSLLTGGLEGTAFSTNLSYGLKTGVPAAAVCWLAIAGLRARKSPSQITAASAEEETFMSKATFGAGCFWGVEDAFRQVPGVTATTVGYAGGTTENPSYRDVCSHRTGHAEVVEVDYDPEKVSYDKLLTVFWDNHDPTTLNRQGPDVGDQYRSVIFFHDEDQREEAEASRKALEASGRYRRPIVTEITAAPTFWRAEEYHQQYFEKTGRSSCRF